MENLLTSKRADYAPVNLSEKKIVVTGGTTGIGRATAISLASQGASVFIIGRHDEPLNEALDSINRAGVKGQAHGMIADISREADTRRIFDESDKVLGGIDILINNAGLAYQSIMEGNYSDWQYILATNLLGYMACARQAIDRMKEKREGHIVNIGSMSADVREKDSSVYVATKAGIQGFSEALRKEVNPHGIKVTLIEPGAVGTDMQPYSVEEQQEKIEKLEMLSAEDIAACVLYTLVQPRRCDIVNVQIRPHLQSI